MFISASLIKFVVFVDIFLILLKVIRRMEVLFHSWSAGKLCCSRYKASLVMKLELVHFILSFDVLGAGIVANESRFAIVLYDDYVCERLRYECASLLLPLLVIQLSIIARLGYYFFPM